VAARLRAQEAARPKGKAAPQLAFSDPEPFSGSTTWVRWLGDNGVRIMTGQLRETPRDDFMLVAEKELIAFERKERELRRQERRERLQQKFPNLIIELQS
jgi:hypothetical protein